jgi:hypothetical protein
LIDVLVGLTSDYFGPVAQKIHWLCICGEYLQRSFSPHVEMLSKGKKVHDKTNNLQISKHLESSYKGPVYMHVDTAQRYHSHVCRKA